ncbi:MAG: DUF4870 domain-containing protein [Actinobacteria bacterium]|nr:DUF4870 domain-containing protein [Actinomycetota bacterium]
MGSARPRRGRAGARPSACRRPLGSACRSADQGQPIRVRDANAVEALNFGILLTAAQLLVSVVTGSVLSVGGGLDAVGPLGTAVTFLPLVVTLAALVLPGMAALQANSGRMGRYPDAMPRFVKHDDDESAE